MKHLRKPLSILLTALLLLSCIPVFAFASDDITVKLRIEGLDACLFYDDVSVDAGATAYDVLAAADSASDDLTVDASVSDYGSIYVSSINGIKAGTYTEKGWDGWQYHVNGADPYVAMDQCIVADGDDVVIFYSDEWGATGFVYPTVSVKEGKVSFSCIVTTYDENWNPVSSEQAITGYTLTWGYGKGKTREFQPDENGVCAIPAFYYTNGEHSLQISKNAENGLPTVLRYAPDFTITVEDADMGFMARFVAFFEMLYYVISQFFASVAK